MTDITAVRGAGDRAGNDIQSPLLCADEIAIVRGRVAIDAETPAVTVTLEARYLPAAEPGKIVKVNSAIHGIWHGQITAVRHRAEGPGQVRTTLTVWRPVA